MPDNDDNSEALPPPPSSAIVTELAEARLRITDLERQLVQSQALVRTLQEQTSALSATQQSDWSELRQLLGRISSVADRHPFGEDAQPDPTLVPPTTTTTVNDSSTIKGRKCWKARFQYSHVHNDIKSVTMYECPESQFRVIRDDPRIAYHPALVEAAFQNYTDESKKPSCAVVARQFVIFCLPSSCEARRELQVFNRVGQAIAAYIYANPHRTCDRMPKTKIHHIITTKVAGDRSTQKKNPSKRATGRISPDIDVGPPTTTTTAGAIDSDDDFPPYPSSAASDPLQTAIPLDDERESGTGRPQAKSAITTSRSESISSRTESLPTDEGDSVARDEIDLEMFNKVRKPKKSSDQRSAEERDDMLLELLMKERRRKNKRQRQEDNEAEAGRGVKRRSTSKQESVPLNDGRASRRESAGGVLDDDDFEF